MTIVREIQSKRILELEIEIQINTLYLCDAEAVSLYKTFFQFQNY